MSNKNPIPSRDRNAFVEHMKAAEAATSDEWQILDAAEEFMIKRKYHRGDPATALEQYRRIKAEAA